MADPFCRVDGLASPVVLAAISGGISEFLRRLRVLAAMLFWAALSDGHGGYACCVLSTLWSFCLGLRR